MIKKLATAVGLIAAATAAHAELEITLTNATQGVYFTPVFAAAHSNTFKLFTAGEEASDQLEEMAEGGDISGLVTLATNASANVSDGGDSGAPGASNGPVAPGEIKTFTIKPDAGNEYLSLAAMLLPTNDGFVTLNNWKIPTEPGTYTVNLNAYDSGTEYNDELASSQPNPPFLMTFGNPGGNGVVTSGGTGVGPTGDENGVVHIHRGNLGDLDASGGASDIDSSKHRWLNPVARLKVVVK
ncbi:spondin domain-containing protein [Bacterioplanoides sp.]|uniref:spondin domain-containing protein n=1 Tax=Bacterioplanoides sp. TaxID=2066072 RepID=UPI003AFFAC19